MYSTKFNTIISLLIKEIRTSRNLPVGAISQTLNKSVSYASKLESGKINLTIDTLTLLSHNLFYTTLSNLIITAEKYASLLISTNKWYVLNGEEIEIENDDLLKFANDFYKQILPNASENVYESLLRHGYNRIDVLGTPYYFYDYSISSQKMIITPLFDYILKETENTNTLLK